MTREEAAALLGRDVLIFAPETSAHPQSHMHGQTVTLRCFSANQPEVVRTSGGPLQFTRGGLHLLTPDFAGHERWRRLEKARSRAVPSADF